MKNKTIIEVARAKLQADHPRLSEDSLARIAGWEEFGPPSYQRQTMKAFYRRREIKRALMQLALSKLNQDGKIVSRNSEE